VARRNATCFERTSGQCTTPQRISPPRPAPLRISPPRPAPLRSATLRITTQRLTTQRVFIAGICVNAWRHYASQRAALRRIVTLGFAAHRSAPQHNATYRKAAPRSASQRNVLTLRQIFWGDTIMSTLTQEGKAQVGFPSEQSVRLEKRLLELKPGESVALGELCRLVGVDETEFNRRSWWHTAKKNAEKNGEMVLERRDKIVCRLTSAQAMASFTGQLGRDYKRARKTVRRISHVKPQELSQPERATLVATQAAYVALCHFGRPKLVKQLESRVAQSDALPLDATIGYFLGHAKGSDAAA
jgi:hypothetical protein